MQALLAITTLDIDRERRVMVVRLLECLYCAKRCVFVDQQIVIAETFAGKHFCQSRLSCINLSSLCQVRNVGLKASAQGIKKAGESNRNFSKNKFGTILRRFSDHSNC